MGALGELPVCWQSAPGQVGERAPVVYVHGVPSNSREWIPFLERTGGLAPDLPGFGRSGKPGHFDYTIAGYGRFLEHFLDLVGVERAQLVMHDWGGVGLAFAQAHPERVERLVISNVVPFFEGYRWHRLARGWRTPVVGELAMGLAVRSVLRLLTRESNVTPGPLPEEWLDKVVEHFDQGTQRAILRLYRNSPPELLERTGRHLAELDMPALVIWGMRDPYIPPRFAHAYAQTLPNAELVALEDAGHWWWMDKPEAMATVERFLGAAPA
jgi:pimeloyl-ACP methyl ester carboxylesterase